MNIAIVGYRGYIGSHLDVFFRTKGHTIFKIDRNILTNENNLADILRNIDVVCCFTGYPIIKRWTKKNRKRIEDSRIGVKEKIVDVLKKYNINLKVFISASAVGIYDSVNFNNEYSSYKYRDFVTNLIKNWESVNVKSHIERMINLRIGIVLGKNSGYVNKLRIPWLFRISPIFNKGKLNFSFIEVNELVRIVDFCLHNKSVNGIVNAVNPEIVKEYYFHDQVRNRIKLFLPNILAKILFGKASLLILKVPKVVPEKLIKNGFEFKNNDLKEVISKI